MKTKMKKSVIYHILCALVSASVITACADTLEEGLSTSSNDPDGVGFAMQVGEQADMTIRVGGTRSSASADNQDVRQQRTEANRYVAHPLEGDGYGLKAVRMSLPIVGIHRGAVMASAKESQTTGQSTDQTTRAAWADHVSSEDKFHDSLTVWGYTRDAATTIFDKTLVQRITNWRTSRHWPFGETGPMRFYAVAPSLESINMSVADADFSTPPVLTYTLPEKAQEMCDLLYGESGDIDIPSFGTEASNEGQDNKVVNLQFQHILTAIRFAQGQIPSDVTVKKISINNVNTKATFVPSAVDNLTDTKGTWSDFSTPGSYTMYASFTGTGTTANTYINDSVFYMLPQTINGGVELEVVIECKPKYTYSEKGTTLYVGEDKVEHILKCSLSGDVWRKGYTVTYLLTIGEVADGYYFVAEAPAENAHSDVVEAHNFTLHSYRMYIDKETGQEIRTHGVNWKVAGYSLTEPTEETTFTDAKPDWLTTGITGNSSGTVGEYIGGYNGLASYNLAAQAPTKRGNHETNLTQNSSDNEHIANNWDLSVTTPNGDTKSSAETANCYIVNRIGTYKFPLVYGNMTADNASMPTYFKDHTGAVIIKRLIKDQMEAKNPVEYTSIVEGSTRKRTTYTWTAADNASDPQSLRARLVWQDASGMLADISATSTDISFRVVTNTPANAVIALQARKVTEYQKKDGEVWVLDTSQGTSDMAGYDVGDWETLWTWHIWMTDEVYPNWSSTSEGATNVNTQYLNNNAEVGSGSYIGDHKVAFEDFSGNTNTILPVNLGWVPQNMAFAYYSKREVWVKLQQVEPAEGAATLVVHIVQHAKQPEVRGQGTFYQWGRPTALPGYNYTDDPGKTKRTIYRNSSEYSDFTVENINNPQDVIANPTKLYRRVDATSMWFSEAAAYWGEETKTVYDPCPPGFKVPHWNIFTGLSLTGETASDGQNLNMWEDAGANFYGGYFYVEHHTSRESLERYGQTVYFPATGQYQATKGVGSELWLTTSPNNNFIEASPGTLWSNQLPSDDNTHGSALNLYPDYGRSNTSKPPVELPRAVNLSTACAIRPVQK